MTTRLLSLMLLAPLLANAQDDCLCCKKQQSGQAAYDKGDYKTALDQWQRGLQITDAAAKCPDLKKLIWKASDRDGDGLVNGLDECDEVAGPASNRGCPLPKPKVPSWLAYIKGGTFDMGDTFGEGSSGETAHKVTVGDFYLSKYEVSFDDFDAFCAATRREKPADSRWGRGKRPVINVDWYDAVEYCNWRSQQDGLTPCYTIDKNNKDPNNSNSRDAKKWTVTCNWSAKGYRLPTEAEWEYAAREGGKKVRFGNGRDVIDPSEINFDARSNYKKSYSIVGEYRQKTVAVDELSANAFGLKNMSGNVWEWCWDWYGEKYYTESEGARNPRGSSSGQYRCLRGGSWNFDPGGCRSAYRLDWYPNNVSNFVGFRVVRPL